VPQNRAGDLLGHVRDTGELAANPKVRLYKTTKRQDFHADGSDIVGLFCLRRAKSGGLSQIVSSISIYNEFVRRRPDLAPRFHLTMDFEPGDIQFLKNSSILHCRTEYEDFDEPDQKRHLLRLWLTAREFDDGDERLRQGFAKGEAA